jgi:hypothetical protein
MPRKLGLFLIFSASLMFSLRSAAQFAPVGGLDCNGFSKVQKHCARTTSAPTRKAFGVAASTTTIITLGTTNPVSVST